MDFFSGEREISVYGLAQSTAMAGSLRREEIVHLLGKLFEVFLLALLELVEPLNGLFAHHLEGSMSHVVAFHCLLISLQRY